MESVLFKNTFSSRLSGNEVKLEQPLRDTISPTLRLSGNEVKFVQLFTLVSTGFWIKDGNVPYRMMSARELEKVVHKIPSDFHLANILVTVLLKKESEIIWIPIHFNKRHAGNPSVKSFSFIKHGLKLFRQLKNAVN